IHLELQRIILKYEAHGAPASKSQVSFRRSAHWFDFRVVPGLRAAHEKNVAVGQFGILVQPPHLAHYEWCAALRKGILRPGDEIWKRCEKVCFTPILGTHGNGLAGRPGR